MTQATPETRPFNRPLNGNTTEGGATVNVARQLKVMARIQPYRRAVVYPAARDRLGRVAYAHLTFRQLDRESDCLAHGLEAVGIRRGVRTIVMVKPSLEFFALTFAMLKVGAVPVMVDPGMGLGRMLLCLQESRAQAMIGISLAHALRVLRPGFFRTVRTAVTIGPTLVLGRAHLSGYPPAALAALRHRRYHPRRAGGDPVHHRQHRTGQGRPVHPRHLRCPGAVYQGAVLHFTG